MKKVVAFLIVTVFSVGITVTAMADNPPKEKPKTETSSTKKSDAKKADAKDAKCTSSQGKKSCCSEKKASS